MFHMEINFYLKRL